MSFLGGSVAFLWGLVNTWTGRANNAWGSSRVWNSGASWESAYNSEVTAYNGMVADRNTWQANANGAWGASGVYGSGESWQAAYNRVLPPAGVVHLSASSPVSGGSDGWTGNLVDIATDRDGQWLVIAHALAGGVAAGARIANGSGTIISGTGADPFQDGTNGYFWHLDTSGAVNSNPAAVGLWRGFASAGTHFYAQAATSTPGGGTLWLDLYFIPTQANPH